MKTLKSVFLLSLTSVLFFSCTSKKLDFSSAISIPTGGNSWVIEHTDEDKKIVSKSGIVNWKNADVTIRSYFKVTQPGILHLGMKANVQKGRSKIAITFGDESREIQLKNTKIDTIDIGSFEIKEAGYHYIDIQGISKESEEYATVESFLIAGTATESKVYVVKDDFYFGRRGPSVHLSFEGPKEKDVVWFYNEIKVPKGEDVIGSYFMANGFKDGYFGIQVNSKKERRILFSVWSPYNTQNPKDIPDDYKIIMLGKGNGVYTGEFGNEGSGGQSYKVFNWKAETSYKFLLKGVPSENNSTDYTAYFFDPDTNKWMLIASFRRPFTNRYVTRMYSFLENFIPSTGNIPRKALYSNQWVYTKDNQWHEMTKARFTADATARKEARMDYAGGVEGSNFFMKNCGFFSYTTEIDRYFTRKATENPPNVIFSELEVPQRK